MFIIPLSFPVGAQEEDGLDQEFELLKEQEIVFSAAKHQQSIEESPSAITVITHEQIENSSCTTLTCLLQYTPEVDVIPISPMLSTIGARAITIAFGDKVLALVDGREINLELYGTPLWEILPVHLEEIERIEIIRGPGSALYGANAYAAVISIITRKIAGNVTEAFVGGGEVNATQFFLNRDQLLGDWRLRLSASRETNNSWEQLTQKEREVNRFRLRLDHEGSDSSSGLDVGLMLPSGLIPMDIAPNWLHDAQLASLQVWHHTDRYQARLWFDLFHFQLDPDVPLFYQGIKMGEMSTSSFLSSTLDAEGQSNWNPWKDNLLIVGGNYRWIVFNAYQNNPDQSFQHRVGLFVQDEQRLGDKWVFTAGTRLDYNSVTPLAVSPRLAAVWKMAEHQTLRLAFGRAFRKPAYYNTSSHSTNVISDIPGFKEFIENNVGNSNLTNELINVFETGYLGHFLDEQIQVEGNLFYNQYRDSIHMVTHIAFNSLGLPDLKNSMVQFQNSGLDVDSIGGSLALTYRIRNRLRFHANYTYRYSFYVSNPPDNMTGLLEGRKGDRVAWEPAHLFNFTCDYLPEMGLRTGMGVHVVSSKDMNVNSEGSILGTPVVDRIPSTLNLSAYVSWRSWFSWGQLETGLRASNLVFYAKRALRRPDNKVIGQELMGRLLFFFVRASL